MKARTFIIITGAIVTLVAPAAQANVERLLPSKTAASSHHRIVEKTKVTKVIKVTKVVNKHTATPRYIYFPAPATPPTSATEYTDQQLCDDYAMNCDLVVASSTNVASPAAPAAVETQASDSSSTESAPVASSSSDSSSASMDSSMACPSGLVWDEDHQYCA